MTRGRQRIEFEGLLQQNVLGTFSVSGGDQAVPAERALPFLA